jgi:phosphotransferase system  glucose/maltose/N-acetylglucosamine-specific IIC component
LVQWAERRRYVCWHLGAIDFMLRNFYQTSSKKIDMNDLTLFGIGLVIFVTYMVFLLRMINKQHKAQEKGDYDEITDDSKKI